MRICLLGGLMLLLAGPVPAHAEGAGEPLFAAHDFAAGRYSLVGLLDSRPRHPIQKQLGNFYVDDPALLATMRSEWRAGAEAPFYACGYHYTILLTRDGEVVESLAINLETECGTVVGNSGSHRFDTALLTRHAARYREPVIEQRDFASLAEARTYLAKAETDPRLLLAPHPVWRDYDGYFRFMMPCPGHGFDDVKVAACIAAARSAIEAKYPGEKFELDESGSQGDDIMVEMKSRKPLHDRFDLYEDYWEWRNYDPVLVLYRKQPD